MIKANILGWTQYLLLGVRKSVKLDFLVLGVSRSLMIKLKPSFVRNDYIKTFFHKEVYLSIAPIANNKFCFLHY
jgi:hypothetical protein